MEAVGAAASVAGVLGFAGQSLNGIIAIRRYVQAIKDAPKVAETIIGDINSLETVLSSIADLVDGFVPEPPTDARLKARISSLERDLKRCLDEVQSWKDDEALRQPTESSFRTALRRVKHAGYKDALEALARRIAAQKETLGFGLTALGRLNDQIAAEKNLRFERELQQMSIAVDSLSDQVSSIVTSLSSIASSLSSRMDQGEKPRSRQRFKAGIPSSHTDLPYGKESKCYWTCDALNGTDDGFEHRGAQGYSRCNFCDERFYWIDDDSFSRQGRHLVEQHGFGKCEDGIVFRRKIEFLKHLKEYHGYSAGNCDSAQRDLNTSWIDLQFSREGDPPEAISNLLRRLGLRSLYPDTKGDDDEPNTHYLILQQLEVLLQSSGIKALKFPEIPQDGGQRRCTTSLGVRQICVSLAALDDNLSGPDLKGWSDLNYVVGCLQEELSVVGYEDVLSLETYLSPNQRKVIEVTSARRGGLPSLPHRLNTGWLLRDHFGRFATLGDALIHCLVSENMLDVSMKSGEVTITDAVVRGLGPIFRSSNSYLRASKPDVDKTSSLSPRALRETDAKDQGDRRGGRSRRIDHWLLGIFVHSISMRRILISGKAVPELASADPGAWALKLLEYWDAPVDPTADVPSLSRPGSEDLSYMYGATFGGGQTIESSGSISSPVFEEQEPVAQMPDTSIVDKNLITIERGNVLNALTGL